MNQDFLYNLLIFIGICILTYIVFRNVNFKEGLENNNSTTTTSTTTNGVAGGAATYAANIKEKVIKSV